jgi:(2S)-methylsuccinyl-CoA dehydrogenase
MTHTASQDDSTTLILPGLIGLLREAADAAGLFVAEAKPQVLAHIAPESTQGGGGKIDRKLADVHRRLGRAPAGRRPVRRDRGPAGPAAVL